MALKSLQRLTTKGFLFVNYKIWLDGNRIDTELKQENLF